MRYLNKPVALLMAIFFILNLSGCETLKKKFTRPPRPGKKAGVVLVPQDYKGIYPNDVLYNNHFVYWRTETEDLIDCLTTKGSNKREVLAAKRAVEDLDRMKDLLISPKKEALGPHIKLYQRVLNKVEIGQPNEVDAAGIRHDLEREKRVILREFDTKEVRAFIIKDDLSPPPLQTIEQTLEDADKEHPEGTSDEQQKTER